MFVQKGADLQIQVHVKASAFQDEIVGIENHELKIKIRANREKGKANEALKEALAAFLDISKSQVEIISGLTSTHKKVMIRNFQLNMLLDKLNSLHEEK